MKQSTKTNINIAVEFISLALVAVSMLHAYTGNYDPAIYNLILAFYIAKAWTSW